MASRSTLPLIFGAIALACAAPSLTAQAPQYDLREIMRGSETVGREPSGVQWSPDSRWIYFSWLPAGSAWNIPLEPYRVRPAPGAIPQRVTRIHMDSMAPLLATGPVTRDGKRRAVGVRGDLWIVDLPKGTARQLTSTAEAEQLVGWSADEQRLFYRTGDNAFALRVRDGFIEQLTDFRAGPAPDTTRRTPPQRAALERDQRELLQVIRDRALTDSLARIERAARDSQGLRPVYLARDERQRGMWVAPTGSHVLFVASTDATTRTTQVPTYVTASGYTEEIPSRTKVGDAPGRSRLGLLDVATAKVTWLRAIASDSSGTVNATVIGWNDAGTSALVSAGTRDNNRRVISRLDIADGRVTPLVSVTDSAWVGGPCGGCSGWLPGDRGIWYVSEADGFAHLYVSRADGSDVRQLTRGRWEVRSARLSPGRDRFLLNTSETSPHDTQFYTMALDGTDRRLHTPGAGLHQAVLSPDGKWIADVHSTASEPPELFVQELRRGAKPARLTTSPTAEWRAQRWIVPEIVQVPASDGVMVPARIYRPEDVGATPNGAAVLFVHGAGYLQNVHNGWSTYFREYQFNHLLAARGYVVLDVDYRASSGYGRDWRTAIYRHMGGRDLEDFVDASKWLTATRGINPERIGIYGGSYGGFITLMALFTRPQYFGAGAALRSVTDWAHYNHGYTANILNEPQDDTTAYRRSSPIFFAEGLDDPLLIAHGMIDTNVHFQDVVRLSQRLIELGKTRWELAVYPVEDHGFTRPDSWTDEYRRILELFDRWLPNGSEGRPARE